MLGILGGVMKGSAFLPVPSLSWERCTARGVTLPTGAERGATPPPVPLPRLQPAPW